MANELQFAVTDNGHMVSVDVKWRLQSRGQDVWLYANNGFGPLTDNDSELLKQIVTLLRLNDSGINRVEVTPYKLMAFSSPIVTAELLKDIVEKAALRTGLKPVCVGTFDEHTRRDGSTVRLKQMLGQTALRARAFTTPERRHVPVGISPKDGRKVPLKKPRMRPEQEVINGY